MAVGLGRAVPSVLVVEDDATVRRFLAENLIADRYAPMSASSAEEAMDLLAGARPEAALIDVGLPGMSGLDLIATIRDGRPDQPWDSGLPILLLSGEASPHAAVRGIERGADDFVAKPFHYPEVLARLGALIRRARGAVVAEEVRVGALRDRPARAHRDPRRPAARPLGQGVRPPRRARPRPRTGSSPRPSCCATSGGTAPRGAPARSTATPAGCGASSPRTAARDRWVVNIWGIGYRLLPEEA